MHLHSLKYNISLLIFETLLIYATFSSSKFTDLLPSRALRPSLLFRGVAPVNAAVGVNLEDVGRAGHDAQALEAFWGPSVVITCWRDERC